MIETTHTLRGEGFDASEGGTGRGTPLVPVLPFDTTQITSPQNGNNPQYGDPCHPLASGAHPPAIAFSCKDNGRDATEDLAPTLRSMGHSGSHANGGGQMAVAFAQNTRDEVRLINGDGQIAGALAAEPGMKQQTYCAVSSAPTFSVRLANTSSNGWGVQEDVTHTLDSTAGPAVATPMAVRRLTPVECERLQSFPDNYTNIPWRGKPESPDGPRYKALGNSMCCNVMHWLGKRIKEAV